MAVEAAYRLPYTGEEVEDLLAQIDGKVDKVDGKGLSTNDFTSEEKAKLAGIESGAEANVNADWNAASGKAQILNKPTIPDVSNFITMQDVQTYVNNALDGAVFIGEKVDDVE